MRRVAQGRHPLTAGWTTTVGIVVLLGLTGCGGSQSVSFGSAGASGSAATDSSPADSTPADSTESDVSSSAGPTEVPSDLAGLGTPAAGEHGTMGFGRDIPAIPAIIVPDVSQFSKNNAAFTKPFKGLVNPVKGISVSTARCDSTGQVVNTASLTAVNNGDGSGVYDDPTSRVVNSGDGSGTYDDPTTRIVVGKDGSGTYDDPTTRIVIAKDGSGTYDDPTVRVVIAKDGSGSYDDPTVRIVVEADGSGSYDDPTIRITNDGQGAGTFDTPTAKVVNDGHGSGHISTPTQEYDVPMDPLPPLAKVDKFPPVKAIKPVGKVCGTLIRLSDQVLFDFDKDTLRPAAKPVLDSLATALKGVDGTLQVNGFTDSVGSDGYNADLSQRRAQAVSAALEQRGVGATITAKGFGEKQPIAANTVAGKDNPSGRQLNRRVEIVVPSAR
jgi:OOP family OmpA-OmpF porin